jgi:hypothetical protein
LTELLDDNEQIAQVAKVVGLKVTEVEHRLDEYGRIDPLAPFPEGLSKTPAATLAASSSAQYASSSRQ